MPVFEYRAIDANGKSHRGYVHGLDLTAAAQSLAKQGLQVEHLGLGDQAPEFVNPADLPPLSPPAMEEFDRPEIPQVDLRTSDPGYYSAPPLEARSRLQTDVFGPLMGSVKLEHLMFFFRQLSAMLDAGISPADSLDTLSRQTKSGKLAEIARETREHCRAGRPMSAGFQRYPEVFTPLMMSMVRVGEHSGLLAKQCRMLSDYIEKDIQLRNLVRRETASPKITLAASFVIIMAANFFITAATGRQGTLPTPWIIWTAVVIIAVAWFLFKRVGLRFGAVKFGWDKLLSTVPGFSAIYQSFAMAKFGRALSALWDSGVPLGTSYQLAADASGSEYIRSRVHPMVPQLSEGRALSEAMGEAGVFSETVMQMVKTGETSGQLGTMMEKVSDYYEDEGETQAKKAATILGVVCTIIVGIYVLIILVQFYGGYFSGMFRAGGM